MFRCLFQHIPARQLAALLIPAALALTPGTALAQKRTTALWLDAGKLDLAKVIGQPPAATTQESKKEFEAVLQITQTRAPEREKEAIADQYQSLARFFEGMGIDAHLDEHREVRLLFQQAQTELGIVMLSVRRLTPRQRPFAVLGKVKAKPCPGRKPDGSSFPAGHAATASLYAALIGEAAPELKEQLAARVENYGESRLICGFHYASDLTAGNKAGIYIAEKLLADRAFRQRFDETRSEIRKSLGLSLK